MVVAYLKGAGYVGVGVVRSPAAPYALYRSNGRTLAEYELVEPNIWHDASDLAICEYIVVEWMASVDRENAKWLPRSGLFTSQLVRASLDAQPTTTEFVEAAFGVDLGALADGQSI